MAIFNYEGKALDGRLMRGTVEANDEAEARVKLRAQQIAPIRVFLPKKKVAASSSSGFNFELKIGSGVGIRDLQVMTRQFATLIASGVPIVQGLQSLRQGSKNPYFREVLSKIIADVEQGRRLADAMAKHPKVFDKFYINLVRAGEEGGVLDTVLNRLATYIEKSTKIRQKVTGALWYPAVVILVAFGVITGILIFVIPNFVSLFKSSGKPLPALTKWVIDASEFFQTHWYFIIGIVIGVPFLIHRYYKTKDGRKVIDHILIKVPVFGTLIQKSAIAKFSRTLSTLLSAGVRIIDSIDIAANTTGNYVIEQSLLKAKDSISVGKTLVEPLAKEPFIPPMVAQMIMVGEQTGALDTMLGKIADFYEDEVETAAASLTSLIEPMLMVFLGGIVAVLVIAMYLPIFEMANVIGG